MIEYPNSRRILTREEILQSVSQESVFFSYLGIYPQLGKKYHSPFRKDSNPGCRFEYKNGRLVFVENTRFNNKLYWDIFDVVMYANRCNFYGARRILSGEKTDLTVQQKHYQAKTKPQIRFSYADFPNNNLFGISNQLLQKEHIYLVTDYYIRYAGDWIKNSIHDPKTTLCIAYYFPKTKNVKLYFPEQLENRWFSTCSAEDIFGWDKIDYYASYSDLLIITKSQKDRIYLDYHLEFPAIALQNEGCYLSDESMEILKSKFKTLVLVFDNDNTGFNLAERFSIKYDIPYLILDYSVKDIYEACQSFSQHSVQELLNQRLLLL